MSEVVLGIDTSTRVCVGLARDGEAVYSTAVGDTRSHVELLLPTVRDVMKKAGVSAKKLTAVAVGMGPGPFTGLRVGVAAAQMLATAWKLPLLQVCGLDVLGLTWAKTHPQGDFVACIDARRKELYWAVYDMHGKRIQGPDVSAPADLPHLPCIGPGTLLYPRAGAGMDSFLALKLGVRVDAMVSDWPQLEDVSGIVGIDAGVLAACASQLPDVGSEPLYLRHADAVAPGEAKSVLPTAMRHVGLASGERAV